MDMEIWLQSLTEGAGTETTEEDTDDNQGGSLPENTGETASVAETVNPDNSTIRTASLTPADLFADNAPVVTMANTPSAQNDEEYNVIFCVDTRGFVPDEYKLFNNIVKASRNQLTNSTDRNKAHIYWYNEEKYQGEMFNDELYGYENVTTALSAYYNPKGSIDISKMALTALDSGNYNKNLETYIFLVFNSEITLSETKSALELLKNINEKNIHISLISGLTTYNNDSYLINMVTRTEGTIINTYSNDANDSDKVASSVVKYIGANEAPIKIISSYSLTPLSPLFDRAYIDELYKNKNHSNDNDSDGLSDYDEIAFESNLIDLSSDYYLPTILQCMSYASANNQLLYVHSGFKRFIGSTGGISEKLASIRILPINSDPTMPDSDGDGFLDCINYFDSKELLNESEYFNINDPNPLKHEIIWQWPLYTPSGNDNTSGNKVFRMSSSFEEKREHNDNYTEFYPPYHSAIDIGTAGATDYEARAMYDGIITAIGEIGNGGGNSITITHSINGEQYKTRFCHLASYADGLALGDYVKAGELIGIAGKTGNPNYRIHLDFRIEDVGNSVLLNPLTFDSRTDINKSTLSSFNADMYIDIPKNIINVCDYRHNDGCDEAFKRVIDKYSLLG
jgi:hypothetical protein